jgi:hypothetical protein
MNCLICKKPVPDYIPQMCCDGRECGCMGMPVNPCICSDQCYDAVMNGIGKPFDERRKDAGIEIYNSAQKEGYDNTNV